MTLYFAAEPELAYLRAKLTRLEGRLAALEERLQSTLEVNELWDGS